MNAVPTTAGAASRTGNPPHPAASPRLRRGTPAQAFRAGLVRLLGLVTGALALLVVPVSVALAQVPPPDPAAASQPAPTTTMIVTHTVSGSGLALWVVLLITAGAVAIGVGLNELVHTARRHAGPHPLATA